MTSKRKRERDDDDGQAKRQRRRKRSKSEPLMNDSVSAEKREALKRLFGRACSMDMGSERTPRSPNFSFNFASTAYSDENDDPLLDSVPVDMDPEQLGFLVCAQETLRFLNNRGIPINHPVIANLRSRLLQGIDELAMA